jgi:septum site-determining protein MinD
MIGLLTSKSRRAELGEQVTQNLLLTRYDVERVEKGEMLKVEDVQDILAVPLLGIIPECPSVLQASNVGTPVILDEKSQAGRAYAEAVSRLLGDDIPVTVPRGSKRGLIDRLLRRTA